VLAAVFVVAYAMSEHLLQTAVACPLSPRVPCKRREAMAQAAGQIFEEDFAGRCIDFGGQAVGHCALVRAQRQLAGRQIDTANAQIAAIALIDKQEGIRQ
jgi:hypothetical protein